MTNYELEMVNTLDGLLKLDLDNVGFTKIESTYSHENLHILSCTLTSLDETVSVTFDRMYNQYLDCHGYHIGIRETIGEISTVYDVKYDTSNFGAFVFDCYLNEYKQGSLTYKERISLPIIHSVFIQKIQKLLKPDRQIV